MTLFRAFVFIISTLFLSPAMALEPKKNIYQELNLFDSDKWHFKKLVMEVLNEQKITYKEIFDDHVLVDKNKEFGLQNILQVVAQLDKSQWKKTIEGHFKSLVASQNQMDNPSNLDNFETAKEKLRIRIFPKSWEQPKFKESMFITSHLPETISVIMIDEEQGAMSLKKEFPQKWEKSLEEVWEQAKQQNYKAVKMTKETIKVGDDELHFFVNEQEIYGSTHALNLQNFKECHGSEGAIFSVPTRIGFLCYPINDLKVVNMLNIIIKVTDSIYTKGPGQTSNHVYWYKNGQFILQPSEVKTKPAGIFFKPTDDFMAMLNSLK